MLKGLIFNVPNNKLFGRTLGAYRMAHVLRQEGWDIEVIDYARQWSYEELIELAKSRIDGDVRFIGFSHMFSSWSVTLERFARYLKQTHPNVLLLSGSGVAPQFISNYMDFYIKGFGENAIQAVLKWYVNGGPMPTFNFLSYARKIIDANTFYPAYPMQDLSVKYEDRDFIQPDEWLTVEFARGCKFKCDFCNFPVLGVKGDYSRDADNFKEQLIDAYNRFGVTNYIVADETFNDRTEKITKFADVVETLPFKPWFSGFVRADLLISRPKDREEMLRMNFLGHYYGIESFNKESVKIVGKGMDPEKIKQGLIDIKNYFLSNGTKQYRGTCGLILGLPYETKDTLESTRQWLLENWQGQSFVPYVLEIPKGQFDTPSAISLDYKKYGYDEVSEEQQTEFMTNAHVSFDLLAWQNEYMNVYDALDIYDKWDKTNSDPNNKFSVDAFSLSIPNLANSLEERLKAPMDRYDVLLEKEHLNLVENYKKRKLSL